MGDGMTYPDPPACYRCGVPGHVDWIDTRTLRDPGPVWLAGNQWCVTPDCVDERGSRTLFAPTPRDLRNLADDAWLRRHRAMTEEW